MEKKVSQVNFGKSSLHSCSIKYGRVKLQTGGFIWIPKLLEHLKLGFLKGVLRSLPKISIFVLYLKIVNTFWKNDLYIL